MSVRKIFSVLCALAFFSSLHAQDVTKPVLIVDDFTVSPDLKNIPDNYPEILKNCIITAIQQLDKVEVVDSHNKEVLSAVQQHEPKDSVLMLKGEIRSISKGLFLNTPMVSVDVYLSIVNPTNSKLVADKLIYLTGMGKTEEVAEKKIACGKSDIEKLRELINKSYSDDAIKYSSLQKPVLIVDDFVINLYRQDIPENYPDLVRDCVIAAFKQLDMFEVVDSHNQEELNVVQQHGEEDSVLRLKGEIKSKNKYFRNNSTTVGVGFEISIINPSKDKLVKDEHFSIFGNGKTESEAEKNFAFPEFKLKELRDVINKSIFTDSKE
ncbi:MAG: hypothetical protein K2I89_03685 [Muribaculaceae bacterium]|nr:hypothetical protein [Muribaculaceae bacterium]